LAARYVGNQRDPYLILSLKHLGKVAGGRAKWAFMDTADSGQCLYKGPKTGGNLDKC